MSGEGTWKRSQSTDHIAFDRRRAVAPESPTQTGLALLVALVLLASRSLAQDADLEQVIVTGSRIARPDFDSASPIVSVTEELFERSGSRTVESALNTLPQFVPSYTSTSSNPGNGGQANVSLRGLGTTSTLVLLDGKRLMPASGNGVPDLNVIPPALIESVEIITGGASAVYGSDALAGVVNFKLKRDFDGVEIDGTWAQTDRGDATQYEAGLTAGTDFAGGRGSVIGFVGYADRELVTNADRGYSKYPLAYIGPGLGTLGPGESFRAGGSPSIEEGQTEFSQLNAPTLEAFEALMESYGYAAGEVPYQLRFGFNTDGTLFTAGNRNFFFSQVPAVANFRGARDPVTFNEFAYLYNFAPLISLQLPLERKSTFARAEFELSDSALVYAQGLYADYSVTTHVAPTPLFDTFIPVDNPFIPDDLKLLLDSRPDDPSEDVVFAKRLSELGPRVSTVTYDVYQATLGLAGDVFDGWKYDAYLQVGANDQEDHQTGNVLTSRIEELTFAPDGGVAICGGFNPFGLGSISRECLDYIEVDASNHASVDQTIVEASLFGPLFALPAGEVKSAFGVFYKEDRYEYSASPVASVFVPPPGGTCPPDCRPDLQGFSASDDVQGDDHNLDIYAELLVPLIKDAPGVSSLETVLGYRLSDYASAGSFDAWKAELLYQPVDGIRVRGSYQSAIRAASVLELYQPQLPAFFVADDPFFGIVDPCAAGSEQRSGQDAAHVEALCLEQGVPAALLPDFEPPSRIAGVVGGNPDLGPEEATTSTVGVVWTSRLAHPLASNLQASLDWYRINVDDKIDWVFFSQFGEYCYDARYNPDFSPTNQWCAMFSRDGTTGGMENVQELLRNAYDWETSGLDLQVDWHLDFGPGQLGLSWLVSWIDSLTIAVTGSTAPVDDLAGTIGSWRGGTFGVGSSFPEWKSNLHLSYAWRDLTLGASWRYIDTMTDSDPELSPRFQIPSVSYFDLDVSYEVASGLLDGLGFGIGIENVTDEEPPIFPSYVQANTDPSQYDAFGRRYYATLRYSF